MERNVRMEDISDGKLYGLNDMVRADCGDCRGCFACCCGMGSSIVLDPLDIWRLTSWLGCDFQSLLAERVELNVQDGLILPNLKMGGAEERCGFLDENGRCSVHAARPGICRLFPLGRFYEDGGFRYFLQTHECRNESRAKVKVRKWIDVPDPAENECFVNAWHDFLKALRQQMRAEQVETEQAKTLSMYLLRRFYFAPWPDGGLPAFYQAFYARLVEARELLLDL